MFNLKSNHYFYFYPCIFKIYQITEINILLKICINNKSLELSIFQITNIQNLIQFSFADFKCEMMKIYPEIVRIK